MGRRLTLLVAGRLLAEGLLVEGTNGAAPGATNPQYGFIAPTAGLGTSLLRGILITGQYDIAGIYLAGGDSNPPQVHFVGVKILNSSTTGGAVAWHLPATAFSAKFTNCNVAPVYTYSQLPIFNTSITAATWSSAGGGTATLTTTSAPNGTWNSSSSWNLTITGVSVSGYNVGPVVGTPVTFNQISYPVSGSFSIRVGRQCSGHQR